MNPYSRVYTRVEMRQLKRVRREVADRPKSCFWIWPLGHHWFAGHPTSCIVCAKPKGRKEA